MKNNEIEFLYTYDHLKLYCYLESSSAINAIKKFSIVLLFIILLISTYSKGFNKYDLASISKQDGFLDISNEHLIVILVCSYLVTCIISWLVHYFSYRVIKNSRKSIETQLVLTQSIDTDSLFQFLKNEHPFNWPLYFFSPDLMMAQFYKNTITQFATKNKFGENNVDLLIDNEKRNLLQWSLIRIEKKAFIENSNWCNIITTCLIATFTLFLNNLYKYAFIIILFRIVSRSIEIAVAFYKDVVQVNSRSFSISDNKNIFYINGFHSSLIRQNGRLSLAIHSLIELFIIFGVAYYLLCLGYDKQSSTSLFSAILFSINLGMFNISFDNYDNMFLSLLHTTQVILSGVLILLSIAQYLGNDKNSNLNDSVFYYKAAKILNNNDKKINKRIIDERIDYMIFKEDHTLGNQFLKGVIVPDIQNKKGS